VRCVRARLRWVSSSVTRNRRRAECPVRASAGYTIVTRNSVIRPQIYVENLFDKRYLLKGAFFSGASVGRPRSVQIRLNVGR
jgi:outer membrane receptor for Fe3+-dicitrate